jgi:hypothetical protein
LEDPELKAASVHAMNIAKENDVKISIDLADPGLIGRNLKDLKKLVKKYKMAKPGANVIIVAGHPFGYKGQSNLIKVEVV